MRCLVTGAGMLGTALARRLRADGHRVVVGDVREVDGAVHLDLLHSASIAPLLDGVDGVFHTAAIHGFREARVRDFFDVNVVGTFNLLETMATAGVRNLGLTRANVGMNAPSRDIAK